MNCNSEMHPNKLPVLLFVLCFMKFREPETVFVPQMFVPQMFVPQMFVPENGQS